METGPLSRPGAAAVYSNKEDCTIWCPEHHLALQAGFCTKKDHPWRDTHHDSANAKIGF